MSYLKALLLGALLQAASAQTDAQPSAACPVEGGSCGERGQSLLQRGLPSLNHSSPPLAADAPPGAELGSGKPHILCIVDDTYTWLLGQWQACARRAVGADGYEQRVRVVNATQLKHDQTSTLQSLSLVQITPHYLQLALPQLLREGLAQKHDMMHVDVDAFLLQDPAAEFMDKRPEADIVAAVDLAGGRFSWYKTPDYLARHNGTDPLGQRGFMLNMGVILFRSNSRVLDMFDELIAARKAIGPTWGDQTLFNEVLLQWDCTWTAEDGSAAPEGESAHEYLYHSTLQGKCTGNKAKHTGVQLGPLNLVVFPFSTVTRFTDRDHIHARTVAMHPGGKDETKQKGLQLAASLCA